MDAFIGNYPSKVYLNKFMRNYDSHVRVNDSYLQNLPNLYTFITLSYSKLIKQSCSRSVYKVNVKKTMVNINVHNRDYNEHL